MINIHNWWSRFACFFISDVTKVFLKKDNHFHSKIFPFTWFMDYLNFLIIIIIIGFRMIFFSKNVNVICEHNILHHHQAVPVFDSNSNEFPQFFFCCRKSINQLSIWSIIKPGLNIIIIMIKKKAIQSIILWTTLTTV